MITPTAHSSEPDPKSSLDFALDRSDIKPMQSNGAYDDHSRPQNSAGRYLAESLVQLSKKFSANRSKAIKILQLVDYGCSTGSNSLELFAPVIRLLQDENAERCIHVSRCDLPSNDFNELARNLTSSPRIDSRFFEAMVASSFNQQILPNKSVHIGACSLALHWVEKFRETIGQGIVNPEGQSQEPVIEKCWSKQLTTFLNLRGNEFAKGGALALCHLTRGKHETKKHGPFRLIEDAIRIESFKDLDRCQIPIYRPSFSRLKSEIETQARSNWHVKSIRELNLPMPFFNKFRQTRKKRVLANEYVGFVQAFCRPTLEANLSHLNGEERSHVLDSLFKTMKKLVMASPDYYKPLNTYSIVELIKR